MTMVSSGLKRLISATGLITRYYSNDTLIQCCFNVRPTSAKLANIKPIFGECAVFAGKAVTVNTHESQMFLDPQCNTTICVSTQSQTKMRELVNYLLMAVA